MTILLHEVFSDPGSIDFVALLYTASNSKVTSWSKVAAPAPAIMSHSSQQNK